MKCLSPSQIDQMLCQSPLEYQLNEADIDFASHLETCDYCLRQLEHAAASVDWWRDTAMLLSSVKNEQPTSNFPASFSLDGSLEKSTLPKPADQAQLVAQQLARPWIEQILQPGSHPELLGRLGQYDVESFLGQGGFGVVFKAHDCELNRPVAIKVLAPHLATNGVARRRFEREAQAAAAVVHPNVVPIHAIYANEPYPFLVMSYIPGWTLQSYVQQFGPLEPKSVVRIAQQVANGLAAAHRQGLIHRDIKPGNILLENGLNRALITDFGLARAADDAALSQTGWLTGTPHYMSPEQAAGEDLDQRSDLFSLGSVIYFMATGREPFRAAQPLAVLQQIRQSKPLSLGSVNPDMPSVLDDVVRRLLARNPDNRWESAAGLGSWLEEYLAHLQYPNKYQRPKFPVFNRKMRWAIGRGRMAAVAGFALIAISIFWWMSGRNQESKAILKELSVTETAISPGEIESSLLRSETSKGLDSLEPEAVNQGIMSWEQLELEIQSLENLIENADRISELGMPLSLPDDSISFQNEIGSIQRAIEAFERDDRWQEKN